MALLDKMSSASDYHLWTAVTPKHHSVSSYVDSHCFPVIWFNCHHHNPAVQRHPSVFVPVMHSGSARTCEVSGAPLPKGWITARVSRTKG